MSSPTPVPPAKTKTAQELSSQRRTPYVDRDKWLEGNSVTRAAIIRKVQNLKHKVLVNDKEVVNVRSKHGVLQFRTAHDSGEWFTGAPIFVHP